MSLVECRTAAEVIANYKRTKANIKRATELALERLKPPAPALQIKIVAHDEPTVIAVNRQAPEPELPLDNSEPTAMLLQNLLREVAAAFDLTVNDLKCESRIKRLCLARQRYCYRAITETPASFPKVGASLGGRDHTTIIHAVRRYCDRNGLPYPRAITPRNHVERRHLYLRWSPEKLDELRRLRGLGLMNKQIAAELGLSLNTVKSAVRRFGMADRGRA